MRETDFALSAASLAARCASDDANMTISEVAPRVAGRTASAASFFAAGQATWIAMSNDTKATELWGPLWPEENVPDKLIERWNTLKVQWEADDADWSFWIEWYERILVGNPLPWELTHRIALEVTPDQWDAGQKSVASRIAEIRAEWVAETLPQIDEIYETDNGLYEVRGIPAAATKLLNSVLDRVSFALDTAIQSNACDLNEMDLAAKLLRRALEIGAEDVNSAESYLRQASGLVRSGIEEGKYAQDNELAVLCQTLDETALQLRADHPEVAEAYTTRLKQGLREISDAKRVELAQSIDALRDGTAPRLNAELGLAAEVTQDGSSRTATAEAVKKSGNWAARITLSERAKQAEGSGWMSMGKIGLRGQTVWELVSNLFSGGG